MKKKMFGIIFTVLGIAGLIAAAVNFASSKGGANVKRIIVYAVVVIFFFSGLGLIKTNWDRSV